MGEEGGGVMNSGEQQGDARGEGETARGDDGGGAGGRERDAGVDGGRGGIESDASTEPGGDRVGVGDGARGEHGACDDKCHFFIGSGDPKNMPVLRAELLRSVYRNDFTTAGKILGSLGKNFKKIIGARELTLDFSGTREMIQMPQNHLLCRYSAAAPREGHHHRS